ncbi:MAG: hypothetical protein ACLUPK_03425 [Veillonella sp.]
MKGLKTHSKITMVVRERGCGYWTLRSS